MDLKICTMVGGERLPEGRVKAFCRLLDQALERLAAAGVNAFACGAEPGFAQLAARRVLALRRRRPEVRLWLVLPGHDQWEDWSETSVRRYRRLLGQANHLVYAGNLVSPASYQLRNYYLLTLSDICLHYAEPGQDWLHPVALTCRQQGRPIHWLTTTTYKQPE